MEYLYDKKAKGLILLSNVINDYPELKKFLQKHNRPSIKDLVGCGDEVCDIFTNKLFSEIELRARSEWKLKSEHPKVVYDYEKNLHLCEYCGKKHIKYVFSIENEINGNQLDIGSSCIKDLGIKTEKEMDNYIAKAKETYRLYELSKSIPNIKSRVENINICLENVDIIVAETLRIKFLESCKQIKAIYQKYLDLKTPDKDCPVVLSELTKALEQHQLYEFEIENYNKQNSHKMLVAKKSYADYLRQIPDASKYIYQTGFVNKLALINIADNSFMNGLIPKINEILLAYGITVKGTFRNSYEYAVQERRELFRIPHLELMENIVEGIFDEPLNNDFSHINILAGSAFADEKSYSIAVSWLIGETVYDYELDLERKELIFYNQNDSDKIHNSKTNKPNAILHRWNPFLSRFSKPMLTREGISNDEITKYILSGESIVYAHHKRLETEMQQHLGKRRRR